jgi:WD40 repeat protein
MKSEIKEIKSEIPLQTDSETQNEISRENAIENYYKGSTKEFSVEDATNTRYLFTSDFNGNIKQFTIKHSTKYIKSHGKVHNGPIHCMIATYNSKYIFTGDWDGTLKQFTLANESQLDLVYNYGEVHRRTINSMAVTPDSQYLFTSSTCGSVKQFDIENRILVQDYGQVHDNIIYSIDLTMNGKWLFTSDKKGQVFQWVLVPKQPGYNNQINVSRKGAKNRYRDGTGGEESTGDHNSKKLKLVEVYKNSYPGRINSVRCSKDSKF